MERGLQTPAVQISNLAVRLSGKTIFSGLNLELPQRGKLTLTGKSGCGKSTLLHCLLGFVTPAEGTIRILGRELNNDSVWELRTFMAYAAQEPELGSGTVKEFLEGPFNFKTNKHLRENLSRVPDLMERLHLDEALLTKKTSSLSGGEKQRFAIISALLLDRKILLLDEPSSALDENAKGCVMELLQSMKSLSILSVSHDREWFELCDEIVDFCKASAECCGSQGTSS